MVLQKHPPALPFSVTAPASSAGVAGFSFFRPLLWPSWFCALLSCIVISCGWFFPPLLGLPPGFLAFRAWRRWRRRERFLRVIQAGVLALAFTGVSAMMGMVLWAKATLGQASREAQDRENVQLIVTALEGWKAEHQGYPASLLVLVQDGWLPWPRLISPWHRGQPQPGISDYQYERAPEGRFLLSRDGKTYGEAIKAK
jgi:hypothetical protein